jgi:hypothetical protein
MASAELSRRVEKVVGYPPLRDMGADQRREFHEALLDAAQEFALGRSALHARLQLRSRGSNRSFSATFAQRRAKVHYGIRQEPPR